MKIDFSGGTAIYSSTRWTLFLLLIVVLLASLPWTSAEPDTYNTSISTTDDDSNDISANSTQLFHTEEDYGTSPSSPYYYTSEPQHALVYPWVVQILGVVTFFLLHHYELPIPFAAVMFVIGMVMGISAFRLDSPLPQLHNSIRIWSDIDSQLLLLVFLPGLIFRDAIDIDLFTFYQSFPQLLVLAFPMVLLGTFLTALVVVYVLPSVNDSTDYYDDFTWSLGLTVGSILASTDPVAVAAVLKQADAPPRLQMHIGGESMLNDGAAVVFYVIFSTQFLAELGLNDTTITVGQGFLTFVRMSLGGVAVGSCFAMGLLLLLYELDRRLDKENNVVQVVAAVSTAYMSYYVSEQVCQMSGVIACVVCGITTKAFGGSRLLADPELMDTYLKLLEHLLNTLLFTLGGTVFGEVIANSDLRVKFTGREWLSLLLLYAFVMLIRGVQVTLFYPVMKRLGMSTNWKEMAFLGFAGLRGAVGIALALSLDRTVRQETTDENSRAITSIVVGLAGGVSFLTLLINGTMAGWVLQLLGLTPPKESRKQVLRLFEISARDFILHAFQKLRKKQPQFETVPFQMIQDHIPFLGGVDQDFLDNLEDEIQSNLQEKFKHRRTNSHFRAYEEMEEAVTQTLKDTMTNTLNPNANNIPACPEEIKKEVRSTFLKLLDAGYQAEIAQGGCRDDHGFTYETLHQSVVFASKQLDCLQDWTYCNSFADHSKSAEHYALRFARWCKSKLDTVLGKKAEDQQALYVHEKIRNRVVRALIFVESHKRAEKELTGYLKGGALDNVSDGLVSVHLEDAIFAVLEESKAQVQLAEDWLSKGVTPEELYVIRSHYMVSILLHKLELYVTRAVRNGRLKETEGRLYLTQIASRVKKALACRSKHNDETKNSSRRRQKQKSTGTSSIATSLESFWNGTKAVVESGRPRPRRKKQQSAPVDSSFWNGKDHLDGTTGERRPSLHRQWSTVSNASAPDLPAHNDDYGSQDQQQSQKEPEDITDSVNEQGSMAAIGGENPIRANSVNEQGSMAAIGGENPIRANRAKPRRIKQQSAPVGSSISSMFQQE